jgi:hypothetical protein
MIVPLVWLLASAAAAQPVLVSAAGGQDPGDYDRPAARCLREEASVLIAWLDVALTGDPSRVPCGADACGAAGGGAG